MAMKNDYFVVKAIDLSDLSAQVVDQLNSGAELVGGISAVFVPDYFPAMEMKSVTVYMQAMIKR